MNIKCAQNTNYKVHGRRTAVKQETHSDRYAFTELVTLHHVVAFLRGGTYLKASGQAFAKLIGSDSFGFNFLSTAWPTSAGSFASPKYLSLHVLVLCCTESQKKSVNISVLGIFAKA